MDPCNNKDLCLAMRDGPEDLHRDANPKYQFWKVTIWTLGVVGLGHVHISMHSFQISDSTAVAMSYAKTDSEAAKLEVLDL